MKLNLAGVRIVFVRVLSGCMDLAHVPITCCNYNILMYFKAPYWRTFCSSYYQHHRTRKLSIFHGFSTYIKSENSIDSVKAILRHISRSSGNNIRFWDWGWCSWHQLSRCCARYYMLILRITIHKNAMSLACLYIFHGPVPPPVVVSMAISSVLNIMAPDLALKTCLRSTVMVLIWPSLPSIADARLKFWHSWRATWNHNEFWKQGCCCCCRCRGWAWSML